MKKASYSFLILLAVTGGFAAGSIVNQRGSVGAAALISQSAARFVCPMHPEVVSDRAGDCPACGMALVAAPPRSGASKAGAVAPGALKVGTERRQLIGVEVGPVERAPFTHTLRMVGRVAPDDSRIATLNAGIDGFVRDVSGATTGSYVKKGQVLATFSSPQAITGIQAFIVALSAMDRLRQAGSGESAQAISTSSNYQQKVETLLDLGMSMEQVEEIQRTHEMPKALRVVAPSDGFVLSRGIFRGQRFQRGTDFYRIADLGRVWVFADVIGVDADQVQPGMRARVASPDRGRSFDAVVSDAPTQFDAVTRTLKVRLELDNTDFALKPDMFVDVELPVALPPSISVPSGAVVDTGLRKTVYVERGGGVFEPREVSTGWRFGDRVQILHGLSAGESVATSGSFLLDSESRMTLARRW